MKNLVSVIVPCYNSATYVAETLDSVLQQTYDNIEVIIVNDGSTDNLTDVIQPYLDKYENFHYYSQENKGLSGARNSGIRISKGQYILGLDADDLIAPTYIERCVDVLDNNPNVKLVYSRARYFDAMEGDWDFPPYSFRTLLIGNLIYASAVMRKSEFEKYGPYDESLRFYEDWNLWINMLKDGGDVVLLDERLFFYRKHVDKLSMSDQRNDNREIDINNKMRIYERYKNVYTKEFGTPMDMLQKIYDLNIQLDLSSQKIKKMREKRILNRIKRIFKSK